MNQRMPPHTLRRTTSREMDYTGKSEFGDAKPRAQQLRTIFVKHQLQFPREEEAWWVGLGHVTVLGVLLFTFLLVE